MANEELASLRKTLFKRSLISTSLPVIILGVFSVLISGLFLYRAIENRNLTIIQQGALQVEKHIATLEKDIRLLAYEIAEGDEEYKHLERFMKNHPEYSSAWITDSTGVIIHAAPTFFRNVGLDKSRSEAFANSKDNHDQVYFSNTLISYELNEPVVTISYPLRDGIIALEYRTGELNRYMAQVTNQQEFYLVLSDKTGTWITHPDSVKVQQREQDSNGIYLSALAKGGARDSLWIRFENRLASYFVEQNPQAGWMVTIYQPLMAIFSPMLILGAILAVIGILLIGLSIIQTWSTVNRTIKPIEHFVTIASSVGNGDYEQSLPDVTFRELLTLKEAFDAMIISIQEREQQQRELWEQLIQSQKMEVVGTLAGGIAHDFNNILTAIGGFSELLSVTLPEGTDEKEYAEEITHSVTRASALTRQLLTFSRKEEVEVTEVEIVSCVQTMMSMLHRIVGEDIGLTFEHLVDETYVKVDKHHLEQIVLNLTVNAADAIREHNTLHPHISITIATKGEQVTIGVADNGPGIPENVVDHIFEPFYTTKPIGKGTGMGLSTVRGIVEQHGAEISVQTGDSGTTFETVWNICQYHEQGSGQGETEVHRGSYSILFVDDEPILRKIGEKMLSSLGHSVTLASDASSALEILEKQNGNFDLLITDIVMPGDFSGDQLVEIVSKRWAAVRALLLSGYTSAHLENLVLDKTEVQFLNKPFKIEDLKKAVSKRMG